MSVADSLEKFNKKELYPRIKGLEKKRLALWKKYFFYRKIILILMVPFGIGTFGILYLWLKDRLVFERNLIPLKDNVWVIFAISLLLVGVFLFLNFWLKKKKNDIREYFSQKVIQKSIGIILDEKNELNSKGDTTLDFNRDLVMLGNGEGDEIVQMYVSEGEKHQYNFFLVKLGYNKEDNDGFDFKGFLGVNVVLKPGYEIPGNLLIKPFIDEKRVRKVKQRVKGFEKYKTISFTTGSESVDSYFSFYGDNILNGNVNDYKSHFEELVEFRKENGFPFHIRFEKNEIKGLFEIPFDPFYQDLKNDNFNYQAVKKFNNCAVFFIDWVRNLQS